MDWRENWQLSGPDIFLSYNREDQAVAKRYAEAFAAEGLNVWWDTALRSGEAYDEVTEAALRGAKAVVVLWSPRSVVSRWVRAEATIADRQRTLVPVTIEPCERPIMFELTQTADLSHWAGDAADTAWQAFLGDVRRFVERASAADKQISPTPQPTAGNVVELPSLAVMPFTNRSGAAEDDAFSDGMVEDLVAALSLNRTGRVVSASATRRFREGAIDLQLVGSELGVRYVLEGNVRRIGESLRVTAQLIEAASGTIRWTGRFDRPLSDLAALQEELVIDVASHLGVQLMVTEIERVLAKPDDLSAWAIMVRAQMGSASQEPAQLRHSLEELRKATDLAPRFGMARAFRGLSAAINYWQITGLDPEPLRSEAKQNAELALQFDPNNPTVLINVAMTLCLTGAWKEGLRAAERAFELNPHHEASHQAMALVCIYFKRPEEALEHLDACIRLAPGAPGSHIRYLQKAGAHFIAGRYFKAIQCTEQCLAIMPAFGFALKDMAIYLEAMGQREDAIEALANFRSHWPDVTLDTLEHMHRRSLLAPDVAEIMQQTLATVWHAAEDPG